MDALEAADLGRSPRIERHMGRRGRFAHRQSSRPTATAKRRRIAAGLLSTLPEAHPGGTARGGYRGIAHYDTHSAKFGTSGATNTTSPNVSEAVKS
jgi:hypothetical protein